MFYILGHYDGTIPNYRKRRNNTHHMSERERRIKKAQDLCRHENAEILDAFIVDKGHRDGEEVHWIFSNGVILITNYRTKRLITVLIGRVGQIYRYYAELRERPPHTAIVFARKHQEAGYNHI